VAKPSPPSRRTAVRRLPERGHYDRDTVHAILDAGIVAHVGFVHEGQPYVLPMGYARQGERLILHGSVASRILGQVGGGFPVCVTVTHLDGIVLARSVFNHSMNYRSVVVLGTATPIQLDAVELWDLLAALGQGAPQVLGAPAQTPHRTEPYRS